MSMIMSLGAGSRPVPPHPGEPVPSVPPIETMGPPFATGALDRLPAPNPITRREMCTRRETALTSVGRSAIEVLILKR
jgi:hypothetical protein